MEKQRVVTTKYTRGTKGFYREGKELRRGFNHKVHEGHKGGIAEARRRKGLSEKKNKPLGGAVAQRVL